MKLSEKKRIERNIGRLHAVKCNWCRLKMACSCYLDEIREKAGEAHPMVMCPRCQVTEFLNLLFGGGRRDDSQSSSPEKS